VDETAPGYRWAGLGIALGCLAALAVLVIELGGMLIVTLALVVVAAGLFIGPARTAVLAAVTSAVGVILALSLDIDLKAYRIIGIVGGSLLGVAVAWAIDRRLRHIRRMTRTQSAIFEAVPDALLVLDDQGCVVAANHALGELVPGAHAGERVHPLLGHVLANGVDCGGGCILDDPSSLGAEHPLEVVDGERLRIDGRDIHIEYTAGRVDEHNWVVSLRDVGALVAADEDRRVLLEAATRQREQEILLRALGSPQLSALPEVPGVDLDMFNVAVDSSPSGRDIVDVTELPDGRVLILMVDALGSGVISVRDAWKVLYVARSYFISGVALSDLLSRTATTLAAETEPPKASVLAAVLDSRTGDLELATGGHPPGLIVHADGSSAWLEASGRGVGAPQPGSQSTAHALLAPTDSLVLYTDGVVSATHDVVAGLSNLRASATALRRRPTPGWARALLEAVLPPDPAAGDATVLLLRLSDQAGDSRQSRAIL